MKMFGMGGLLLFAVMRAFPTLLTKYREDILNIVQQNKEFQAEALQTFREEMSSINQAKIEVLSDLKAHILENNRQTTDIIRTELVAAMQAFTQQAVRNGELLSAIAATQNTLVMKLVDNVTTKENDNASSGS